jgi:hypothetical protein
MKNVFVYLVGPPGVGKFTVGKVLAERLPAVLVDNHTWLNPVFRLIAQDGVTSLPAAVWSLADRVRSAVLETMATVSPRDWNFIVTHGATGHPDDSDIARKLLAVGEHREARILVARLTCAPEPLADRVAQPERRDRMKDADTEAARRNALLPPFDPGHPNMITIDTSTLTAMAVADRIVRALDPSIKGTR